MKKIKQLAFIGIALAIFLSSCSNSDDSNSGDKFLGSWKHGNQELTITKSGNNALAIAIKIPGQGSGRWVFTNKDGNFINSEGIILSYSNGKVIYYDEEYEKAK